MIRALYIISLFIWLCPQAQAEEKTSIAQGEIPAITVLADRALTVPLTRLASKYSQDNHVSVTVTFAPSFEQMLAIEEGEAADIFISAQQDALKRLKQSGLFDVYSITPLIKSRFALITSTDFAAVEENQVTLSLLKQIKKQPDFLLAVANEAATAEGYYSGQVIDKLRSDIFLSSNLVQMQNTQDILDFMQKIPAYGIIFEPDSRHQTQFKNLGIIPEAWHEEAIFTGVAIAGGTMKTARSFLKHLTTPPAQKEFVRYGLSPINAADHAMKTEKSE